MEITVSGGVTVIGVADVGGVVGAHGVPLLDGCVQIDGSSGGGSGNGSCTLILTNEVDQLVEVVILQCPLGRLNVTGKFVVILIGEGVLHGGVHTLGPYLNTAYGKLVPARDENDLGIDLQRVLELLREVVAPLGGLSALLLVAILILGGVGAAGNVISAHGGQHAVLIVVVHGNANRHLLDDTISMGCSVSIIDRLRIHGQPSPIRVGGLSNHVFGLSGTEGKEACDLLLNRGSTRINRFLASHDHGLAIPVEPQIGKFAVAENVHVQGFELDVGVRCIVEGQHEGDLGGTQAVVHGLCPRLHESRIVVAPRHGRVRIIRKDHVHAGIGQKLGLLTKHPPIVATIEAVDGLIPPEGTASQITPELIVPIPHRLGVLLGHLLKIHRGRRPSCVPRPVEHGQCFVVTEITDLGVGQGDSSKSVGEHPRVGHDLVGIDEAILGNDVGGRGYVVAAHDITGLGAFQKVISLLLAEDHLHDRILNIIGHGVAVLIDVTLEILRGLIHVHGGTGVHVMDEEQVIACGNLVKEHAL